jgi:hypothetical protein
VEPLLTASKKQGSQNAQDVLSEQKDLSQTTTNTKSEIPDNDMVSVAKTCQKTPDEGEEAEEGSGNDTEVSRSTQGKSTTQELPDTQVKEIAKNEPKTPERVEGEQVRVDNEEGPPDMETEAPEEEATASAKPGRKTPKRKYKTEVEKLIELQGGLEITTSRRGGELAVVSDRIVGKTESNGALIEGDGP